jgi:hypothetical protein
LVEKREHAYRVFGVKADNIDRVLYGLYGYDEQFHPKFEEPDEADRQHRYMPQSLLRYYDLELDGVQRCGDKGLPPLLLLFGERQVGL